MRNDSSYFQTNSYTESRQNSIIETPKPNSFHMRKNSDDDFYKNLNSLINRQRRFTAKYDTRYELDLISIQGIDVFKFVNKYAENFLSSKEFNNISEPNIKNYNNFSKSNSDKISSDSMTNSESLNFNYKYYNCVKKRPHLIIFLAFSIFFLIIFLK